MSLLVRCVVPVPIGWSGRITFTWTLLTMPMSAVFGMMNLLATLWLRRRNDISMSPSSSSSSRTNPTMYLMCFLAVSEVQNSHTVYLWSNSPVTFPSTINFIIGGFPPSSPSLSSLQKVWSELSLSSSPGSIIIVLLTVCVFSHWWWNVSSLWLS